jgi:hypothetical protein
MTVLSRIVQSSSVSNTKTIHRIIIFRINQARQLNFDHLPTPPKATIQIKPPAGEVGHMKYEHYWSRDPRYKPQVADDTWKRFIICIQVLHK